MTSDDIQPMGDDERARPRGAESRRAHGELMSHSDLQLIDADLRLVDDGWPMSDNGYWMSQARQRVGEAEAAAARLAAENAVLRGHIAKGTALED